MPQKVLVLALLGGAAVVGCAQDVVLPDIGPDAVCGDGVVQASEGCDVESAGCVDCQIAPGWVCPGNVCSQTCGDGIVGTGSTCANAHRDTDCDMTGYWVASETDYTCDNVFHAPQTSSNWYLYHFVQEGSSFHVDEELDCGVHVTGSATVDYTPGTLKALLYLNSMDGSGSHPARQGTSQASGAGEAGASGCTVSLDRWYNVFGAVDSFLPDDFSTHPDLSSLPALPSVSDPINGADPASGPGSPPGTTDPDGDGFAGLAVQITGVARGVRDSVQREWKGYATPSGAPVAAAALQFDVPGAFDLQENILHVSDCGTGVSSTCGLLTTAAAASKTPGKVTLAFLGKTLAPGTRVSKVVAGVPRQSVDADTMTCVNVRLVVPHDSSAPPGACP